MQGGGEPDRLDFLLLHRQQLCHQLVHLLDVNSGALCGANLVTHETVKA